MVDVFSGLGKQISGENCLTKILIVTLIDDDAKKTEKQRSEKQNNINVIMRRSAKCHCCQINVC